MSVDGRLRPRLSQAAWDRMTRERIMRATINLAAESGPLPSVKAIVKSGGCARGTFYRLFDDREDCLQQTLGWVLAGAHARLKAAGGAPWGVCPPLVLDDLLAYVRENPAATRLALVWGPAISLRIFEAGQESFTELIAAPGLRSRFIVGGISSMLYRHSVDRYGDDPGYLYDGLRSFVEGQH